MQPAVEQQLRAQARSLRALARDLVGDNDADDLVQDTALQVLRSPPRPGPLAAWFATVLRHLAFRHRRAQRRRAAHEANLAAPGEAAPAEAGLEQQEMLRRVTAAVLALPQPYRGAVLLRYFEDLTPTQIAARDGVPIATVKSRLQRGLQLLRQRLDADGEGGEWRAALTGAFGLGSAAAVAAGVVLMGTAMKLALGAAAAAAAVAAWFMIQPAPPAAPTRLVAQQSAPSAVAADGGADTAAAVMPTADRREVAVPPPTTITALATIRGRCVAENGDPVAGIPVAFRGKPIDDKNTGAFRSVSWQDPPRLSTPTDGRFEFRFAPPRSFRFELSIGDGTHVGGYCSWATLAVDQAIDIGDVPILDRLVWEPRLHVVDTNGKEVAHEVVALEWTAPPWFHSPLDVACGGGLTTDDAGVCRCQYMLPGSYRVSVDGREVVSGAQLQLTATADHQAHEVVVRAIDAADVLRGIVVDEAGAPVPRVGITGMAAQETMFNARTATDGTFRILRKPSHGTDPVQLWVNATGFEPLMPTERFAWGRTDLRLVLRHNSSLQVLAVDDAGKPVEDYRAWTVPDQTASFHGDGEFYDVRASGRHPGWIATIASLRRGPYFVIVQADDETLATSRPVPITVGDAPGRAIVRLQRATERMVKVQHGDGTPVIGSTVRLLDPVGNARCLPNRVVSLQVWVSCTGNGTSPRLRGDSVLLQETTTDAHGEATLRAANGTALTVFVQGAHHCPTQADGVRIDVAEPLVITVLEGARLTGRAQPEIVHALRELAGLAAIGTVVGQNRDRLPGIVLTRGETGSSLEAFPPENSRIDFADDGSFSAEHVPPGTWHVVLQTVHGMQPQWETAATVDLREGESSDAAIDLTAAMPCELTGRMFLNDKPLDSATLPMYQPQLLVAGRDIAGKDTGFGGLIRTDADGRYVWRGRAGTVTLQKSDYVTAPESVVLTPGCHATQDFHIRSGIARLHLLDADGKPVPESLIEMFDSTGTRLPTWTDAAGIGERELLTGTFRVQAQRMRDGKPGPIAALGEFTIDAGQTNEVTLRLPRE